MTEDIKTRLEAIVKTTREIDNALLQKQQAALSDAQQRDARRQTALNAWQISKTQIHEAIDYINAEMAAAGMKLVTEDSKKETSPAIAQFQVLLQAGEMKGCKLVLNVNAFGTTVPVFLIPHTGKSPGSFDIRDVGVDHYKGIFVNFIEQVLKYRQEKI